MHVYMCFPLSDTHACIDICMCSNTYRHTHNIGNVLIHQTSTYMYYVSTYVKRDTYGRVYMHICRTLMSYVMYVSHMPCS